MTSSNKKAASKKVRTTKKASSKATAVDSQKEKEKLIKELKETTQQLGRLPRLMLAPILGFISKKYEGLPADRRKQLQNISKDMKKNGSSALANLKTWFQSIARHDGAKNDATPKKSVKNTTVKKKTTPKKTTKKKTVTTSKSSTRKKV